MIPPVRCFNCGKCIYWDYYVQELRKRKGTLVVEPICFDGKKEIPETEEAKVLKEMQVTRYCCRMIYLTHVELSEKL